MPIYDAECRVPERPREPSPSSVLFTKLHVQDIFNVKGELLRDSEVDYIGSRFCIVVCGHIAVTIPASSCQNLGVFNAVRRDHSDRGRQSDDTAYYKTWGPPIYDAEAELWTLTQRRECIYDAEAELWTLTQRRECAPFDINDIRYLGVLLCCTSESRWPQALAGIPGLAGHFNAAIMQGCKNFLKELSMEPDYWHIVDDG